MNRSIDTIYSTSKPKSQNSHNVQIKNADATITPRLATRHRKQNVCYESRRSKHKHKSKAKSKDSTHPRSSCKTTYFNPTEGWAVFFDVLIPSLQMKPTKIRFAQFDVLEHQTSSISLQDYSKQELEKCFYTEKEIQRMEKEQMKTVQQIEKTKNSKDEREEKLDKSVIKKTNSFRGLEGKTTKGLKIKKKHREKCIEGVVAEQDDQWDKKIFDWERLAAVSRKLSKQCVKNALKNACRDAEDASKIHCGKKLSHTFEPATMM